MNLRENIKNYISNFQEENEYKERMLDFLDNCDNPFSRETKEGHFTSSGFLLNSNKTKFLLMHHRKLDKWLQPGGHCDGNNDLLAVAIKEAQEESGILDIEPISRQIYDIDVHFIPSNAKEQEHYHYDVRFLLKTVCNDYFVKNAESHDLRWIEFTYNYEELVLDSSVKRMIEKYIQIWSCTYGKSKNLPDQRLSGVNKMDQAQIVDNKKLIIDSTLVSRLLTSQFPQWKDLPVQPVVVGGWDNRTFHLGKQMLVRMPSAAKYAMKVKIEQKWLPKLAPLLPLPIPEPLAMGEPGEGYPWRWSIYRWIEGDTAASAHIADQCDFATNLAQFLIALQRIDTTDGPLPGLHNFYRGGTLKTYDIEIRQAIDILKDKIDTGVALELWEAALATTWQGLPVWVHGDISVGNLLVQEGKLSAVIDFGGLGIGDPACDLAIAWNMFGKKSREVFRTLLSLDADTWNRGRAWSLWKALIIVAGFAGTNAVEVPQSWRIINEILTDYKNTLS